MDGLHREGGLFYVAGGTMKFVRRLWTWLFGRDDYLNGEHIAHEPSFLQRWRVCARPERFEIVIQIKL